MTITHFCAAFEILHGGRSHQSLGADVLRELTTVLCQTKLCLCNHAFLADGKVQGAVLIGSGYDYNFEIEKISRPAILRLLNFHFINCTW